MRARCGVDNRDVGRARTRAKRGVLERIAVMLIVAGGYFLEMALHEARRSGPSKATTGTMTVLTL